MKTIKFLLAILFAAGLTSSLAQDTWTRKADFGGTARYGAVGFSIGSKGYIGTGYDGSYKNDFWEYDPSTNAWTQKANFGGTGRYFAVGFSIGSKGYIGTGTFNFITSLNDFWEYDPATNAWAKKADFGGTTRWGAVGFSVANKGYIGTGTNDGVSSYYNDFWEYDPTTNGWTQKANFGGGTRGYAVGFSISNKGYIGTGTNNNLNSDFYFNDFWEYDPATNAWAKKADFGGTTRLGATGFSIGSKGYLGTGVLITTTFKDFWEYDPSTNGWTQKANFGGTGRWHSVGFSIGSIGFIGTGYPTKKDFWEYTPDENICTPPSDLKVTNVTDSSAKLEWTLSGSSSVGLIIHYHPAGSNAWREKIPGAGATHVVLKNLLPNTTYKWQIRSVCSDKLSGWAKGPDFTTASSFALSSTKISDALTGGNFGISISPNPVIGNVLNLHITNANATNIQLGIADMQGRIFITQNVSSNGGSLNKVIDVSAIPKGIYILKIISNKHEQQQIKFVKTN